MGSTRRRRRSDLRGFLKQSQKKTSEIADERSSSYLINNSAAPIGSSRSSRKEWCDEEEVVRYMSKLPGYLQGEESSLQSNVLNVGVLDWSRLEKWKKHGRGARGNDDHHHQVHTCSNLGKKVKGASRVRGTLEPPELASSSSSSLDKQEMPTCSYKSSARDGERVKSRRSLSHPEPASSSLLSTMGNSGGAKGRSFMVRDKETEKRAGEVHAARESGKQCVDKIAFGGGSNHQKVSNIVLLRSRKQSPTTLSDEPKMPSSLDDNAAKVARKVNRSLDLERDSEDMMLPLLLGVDHSAQNEPPDTRTKSQPKTASSRRMFDQEKKRDPSSPSKRFSFSFGRLSRKSFTFKEEEDSLASDSMRLDGQACPSQSTHPEEEKQNLRCGTRVSPLTRLLLDPSLLKPKDPEKVLQDEKKKHDAASRTTRALLQLTNRNGIPLFQFVVDYDNNLNKSKSKNRSILGATMKSSSFKDDGSVQYCTFYSVNEVKKKNIGSWLIHHGHNNKDKQQQHRFVYNVIGEMRLCNSSSSTEHKSENVTSVVRESVLFDETKEGVKGRKEVAAVVIKKKKKKHAEGNNGETTTVIIPGGVHSIPEKGAPTPLIRRWRSGGCCDCGGWDVGCKLHVLSHKTFLHELFDQTFKLFHHEESDKTSGPVLAMRELKAGIYRVEFGSFLSPLQAFFVCVTVITCASEEVTVSKTTGRSSSPFAPPLSPVGRA